MNPRLDLELSLRRHSWPKVAGALALVAASLLMLVAALMQGAKVPSIVQATDGSRQLETQHHSFRAILIPNRELEAHQHVVLDMAARHGLNVGRIDYGFENRESGRFGVATLQFLLRGSYAGLHAFLAAALAAQPALAIEDLTIERESVGQGVEARLKLGFHAALPAGQ